MSEEIFRTVARDSEEILEEKRSEFICAVRRVATEEEAMEFVKVRRKMHPDARHTVFAYLLKDGGKRYGDDSEPQGTAGMPVLDAIRKRGCTDIAIVVIRYFGGTLLGTGGLVRAYSAAAVGALEAAEIITYDIYSLTDIEISYSDYQKIMPILSENGYRVDETLYANSVIIKGRICKNNVDALVKTINEATSGRAKIDVKTEIFDF